MNIEKVIRILGYIVYTALWSPLIVLYILIAPIVCVGLSVRTGQSVREAIYKFWDTIKAGFKHDVEFIRTGVWNQKD